MTEAAVRTRALISPQADFWLLGGASLLSFFLYLTVLPYVDREFRKALPVIIITLSFVMSYPHFAYSYLLFYRGFTGRLFGEGTEFFSRIRHALAGIIVPAALAAYFAVTFHERDTSMVGWGYFVMLFTVGWHYVKQGYGVLITLSLYKGVFYGVWEKRALWINAYAVWLWSWAAANNALAAQVVDKNYPPGLYPSIPLPDWVVTYGGVFACITTLAAAAVVLAPWLEGEKKISVNAVVGYVSAIYMWVLMPRIDMMFYAIVPLFHGLQYLPFVYKFKREEFRKMTSARGAAAFTLLGLFAGAVLMEFFPKALDRNFGITGLSYEPKFYLTSFIIFINVHHFFIDAAFWRRDNKDVQNYLFKA
ncbi:MAG: hypothetical protein ACAH80_06165 [Alphaproteobacteria bacterium]